MKKIILIPAALAATLVLTGCPTFEVGGWIDSTDGDGNNTKATFGGAFSCTIVPSGLPEPDPQFSTHIEGEFVYHDHNFSIDWKGRERDLSFHGVVVEILSTLGPEGVPLCEIQDDGFVDFFGAPDGYCGPATLSPAPKEEGDTGFGQNLAYRIAVTDGGPGGDDTIDVWLGPEEFFGGCPINKNGVGNDDASDCSPGDFCYYKGGVLGGGQVVMDF